MSPEHKWTSLSVIDDCGCVLGTFYTVEDYNRYRSDAWRSKNLKTTDCVGCKKPIDWDKCLNAMLLETRYDPEANASRIYFEEIGLSKKEIAEIHKPEKVS